MGFGGIGVGSLILILVMIAVPILIFGPVAKKAGFSRWWSLLLVIPLVNLIVIWVFSFMEWPVEKNA